MTEDPTPTRPPPEDTTPESGWDERADDQTPAPEPLPEPEDTQVDSGWLEEGDLESE